jgi:hypothetical protein
MRIFLQHLIDDISGVFSRIITLGIGVPIYSCNACYKCYRIANPQTLKPASTRQTWEKVTGRQLKKTLSGRQTSDKLKLHPTALYIAIIIK